MLTARRQDLKVIWPIVCFLAIPMVYNLRSIQVATERRFRHEPMLSDVPVLATRRMSRLHLHHVAE